MTGVQTCALPILVIGALGFVVRLRHLRDLRETHGVLFGDWLSKLACLSPADYADYADEYSKLYYFAEKDRLGFVYFGETA